MNLLEENRLSPGQLLILSADLLEVQEFKLGC